MEKTDRLSRRLDQKVGTENDNNDQTLIKKQWIYNLVEVVIEEQETKIIEKIKKVRSKNKKVIKVVEKMKKVGVKELRGEEWQIEGYLILKKEKYYKLKTLCQSKERILYWVNTRELNRELCIGQSTLYTKASQFVLTTSSLP